MEVGEEREGRVGPPTGESTSVNDGEGRNRNIYSLPKGQAALVFPGDRRRTFHASSQHRAISESCTPAAAPHAASFGRSCCTDEDCPCVTSPGAAVTSPTAGTRGTFSRSTRSAATSRTSDRWPTLA